MADTPKTLNQFYNEMRDKGVLLAHQFQLSFSGMEDLGGNVNSALENISMWAQGSTIPGRTIEVVDVSYLGYPFGLPGAGKMTTEITLTINASQNLEIRDALLFWQGTISDADLKGASANGGNKKIPRAKAHLDLYNDKMDTILHKYVLNGIFPTTVGDLTMSNTDASLVTFDGTFRYQFWNTEKSPNAF